jgi:hypothetical protein
VARALATSRAVSGGGQVGCNARSSEGIRGGTVREIASYARGRATLVPPRQGSYGRLWFDTTPHRRRKRLKRLFATIGMIPNVTLALRRL